MNLATVRTNLAAAAEAAGDLDSLPYVPDSIAPPTLAVGRMQISYDQTMGGLVVAVVTLHAFTSRADSEQGQDDLLPLLAPDGVKAAVETDRTLDGACQELRVESADGPGLVEVGGVQFWSASWQIRVWG